MSATWRMGDPTRLWPEEDEELQQFCLNTIGYNDKIVEYFDDIFPDNNHLRVMVRLMCSEHMSLLMSFCKNKTQRQQTVQLMRQMNQSVKQQELIRDTYVNRLQQASEPDSRSTFEQMLEWTKEYDANTVSSIKNKNGRKLLGNLLKKYRYLVNFYIENVKINKKRSTKTTKRMKTNPCPSDWRPYSVGYAQAMAFQRIISR
ncbi:uncharacterized protein LOC128963553 [Oppia nitens]|uniref:uncharacterized protein LOC128963553 n=1 Tax=Oppia nitens TaxID=1686743 RepID=UPI0023DCDAD1|nr:uncharacterized protein LOC128963553 [Oppia nitens]